MALIAKPYIPKELKDYASKMLLGKISFQICLERTTFDVYLCQNMTGSLKLSQWIPNKPLGL